MGLFASGCGTTLAFGTLNRRCSRGSGLPLGDAGRSRGAEESPVLKYALSDLPALLRTPLGRLLFAQGVRYRAWPLYAAVAAVYRRTLVRRTRFVAVVGSFGKSTTARATMAALGGDPSRVSPRNAWTSIARPCSASAVEIRTLSSRSGSTARANTRV